MRVVIAGGHGQIALLLERLLVERGDEAVGIVRNADHVGDLKAVGADAVVLDLERASVRDVAGVLVGADAAVFAAGAGPGSGAARKETVDLGAAVLFAEAAVVAGVRRHIQVSAMGLGRAADGPHPHRPAGGRGGGPTPNRQLDDVFRAYLRAKDGAERDLRGRAHLDWTILRPGRLTDRPATGRVRLGESVPRGEVSRADVAAVLLQLLDDPSTVRRTLELVSA